MYGALCSGAALGYALFFRSRAAHSACVQEQRSLWQHCAQRSAQHNASGRYAAHNASLDSTHAFCVRVRFKLCKTQAVAEPSTSLARGASRPSVSPLVRSPLSQRELQRGLHRAGRAKRASATTHPSEGMDPTP